MWIARDKNGTLALYNVKPVKEEYQWNIPDCNRDVWIIDGNLEEFREVKWEDEEPKELVLKQYEN
jgi:hypothetical protein